MERARELEFSQLVGGAFRLRGCQGVNMTTISLEEAQANLAQLIHQLPPGNELVITENNMPVARLMISGGLPARTPRRPGTLRGTVLYMAPDFDAPLEDFKEYME